MTPLQQLRRDTRTRAVLDGRRDRLIREARAGGATWREIAETVGLTQQAVMNAAARQGAEVIQRRG